MSSQHISDKSSPQALLLLHANQCAVGPKGRSQERAQSSRPCTLTQRLAEQQVSASKSFSELANP